MNTYGRMLYNQNNNIAHVAICFVDNRFPWPWEYQLLVEITVDIEGFSLHFN